jgi:predicted metal-dependent hydrolase
MKFDYEGSPLFWFDGEPVLTRFVEALSMLFPEGERFFVASVKHYLDQIRDPELRAQVTAFAAQEGTHAAEHHKYNIRVAGPKAAAAYEALAGMLKEEVVDPLDRLAVTVALEHFTAILADEFLRNPAYAAAMDPEHARLWLWHAVEECEHKAVAFDVYKAVGGEHWRRCARMLRVSVGILASAGFMTSDMLSRDKRRGRVERVEARNVLEFVKWALVSPGFFRHIMPQWLAFFRRDFHPWQHDNSELIARWKATYEAAAA